MNQRQLAYFLEVYSTKSISKAASNLFVTPQGISKTIAALEKELGTNLFEHKHNRIVPTNEAARLSIHAKNILEEYELITDRLFKSQRTIKNVSIYCSYDFPQLMPATFFKKFHDSFPEIQINMKEFTDDYILERIKKHNVELGIIPGPFNPHYFGYEQLCSEPFCLVVNKKHPLSKRDTVSFSEISGEPMVVKDAKSTTSLNQLYSFDEPVEFPNIILETSDIHLIHSMAEENYAIGMSLEYLAKKNKSDKLKIVHFKEEWLVKKLYIVYNKDNILSAEANALKGAIVDYFNNLQAPV